MKKISKMTLINIFIILFTSLSLILYIVNCNSIYFKKFGVDIKIIIFLVLSIITEIYLLVMTFIKNNKMINMVNELIEIAVSIFMIVSISYLLDAKIYYTATILTYEKTNQNVSDLMSALISFGSLFVAFIISTVSNFLPLKKDI